MTEVEKLYSLAGVEPDYDYFTFFDDKVHKIGRAMHLCKEELKHWLENYQKDYVAIKVIRVDKAYPHFTAEKQLELIKFLYIKYKKYEMFKVSNRDEVGIRTSENTFYAYGIDMQNAIANFFNRNWQDLTEAERTQIKEILE